MIYPFVKKLVIRDIELDNNIAQRLLISDVPGMIRYSMTCRCGCWSMNHNEEKGEEFHIL